MVSNIREPKTEASVLPQYNVLNFGYRMYVQMFERIEKKEYPDYIDVYREKHGVTDDRIQSQMQLIADLLDGMAAGEYVSDKSMAYLHKAMQDCRWQDRFDWEAMAVFDMLASQSMLAFYFVAMSEVITESEIKAQNMGELRKIIDRLCRQSSEIIIRRIITDRPENEENAEA